MVATLFPKISKEFEKVLSAEFFTTLIAKGIAIGITTMFITFGTPLFKQVLGSKGSEDLKLAMELTAATIIATQ